MKKTLIVSVGVCVLGLVVASPAFAKDKKKHKSEGSHAVHAPAASTPPASAPPASGSAVLAHYDTDKDGALNDTEIEALKTDYAEKKTAILKQYDADNNGVLDDSEIAKLNSGLNSAAAPGKSDKSGKQGKKK